MAKPGYVVWQLGRLHIPPCPSILPSTRTMWRDKSITKKEHSIVSKPTSYCRLIVHNLLVSLHSGINQTSYKIPFLCNVFFKQSIFIYLSNLLCPPQWFEFWQPWSNSWGRREQWNSNKPMKSKQNTDQGLMITLVLHIMQGIRKIALTNDQTILVAQIFNEKPESFTVHTKLETL